MRQKIEEKFLRLVRFYTSNTPVKKGKYRLFQVAMRFYRARHDSLPVKIKDGRRFVVDLTTGMQEGVFFIGEYEKVISEITEELIISGDICIDAGANFGWYTSLMALHTGSTGEVHAFEPAPRAFDELVRNNEFIGSPANITLNNLALGDRADNVQIHMFQGLSSGHASIRGKKDVDSTTIDCKLISLDSYLELKRLDRVDFLKADIEGAELMLLEGATRLFAQEVPPIFLMEMALAQTRNFGYVPDDLIAFIAGHAEYYFYRVNEYPSTLSRIEGFAPNDIGANVFCIPAVRFDSLWPKLEKYLAV